jgi:hypothetical protein
MHFFFKKHLLALAPAVKFLESLDKSISNFSKMNTFRMTVGNQVVICALNYSSKYNSSAPLKFKRNFLDEKIKFSGFSTNNASLLILQHTFSGYFKYYWVYCIFTLCENIYLQQIVIPILHTFRYCKKAFKRFPTFEVKDVNRYHYFTVI